MPTKKIRHGGNLPGILVDQRYLLSPDLLCQAKLVSVGRLQTTLAQPYAAGSGVLEFANPNFPEGPVCPNAYYGGLDVFVHGPSSGQDDNGQVHLYVEKLAGSSKCKIQFSGDAERAAFEAKSWPAGTFVDCNRRDWENDSAVPSHQSMEEYVKDGRRTGYPKQVRLGEQAINCELIGLLSRKLRIPAGDWHLPFQGTGRVQLNLGFRDGTANVNATIDYVGGVATTAGGAVVTTTSAQVHTANLRILSSDPADPLHDGHVIVPGSWGVDDTPYAGLAYHAIYALHASDPAFFLPSWELISPCRLLTHIRFGDIMQTILNFLEDYAGVTTLATRTSPYPGLGKTLYSIEGELPWEWAIAIANLARCDIWLAVGHEWADETTQAFFALASQALDWPLRVIVADSIEVWNGGFSEYYAACIRGVARYHPRARTQAIAYDSASGRSRVTQANHGVQAGDRVFLVGHSDPAYRGTFTVAVADAGGYEFAPRSTPASTAPAPRGDAVPSAWKVGEAGTFELTGATRKWFYNVPELNAPYSGIYCHTTVDGAVGDSAVVEVVGFANPDADGAYRTNRFGAMDANEFTIGYKGSGLHYPVLPPATEFADLAPLAGDAIRGVALSNTKDQAEAGAQYHGYRTSHAVKIGMAAFADRWDRLVCLSDGWAGGREFNRTTLRQIRAEFAGHYPPVMETWCSIADYYEPSSTLPNPSMHLQDQAADYVGPGLRLISSASVSGGVATATTAGHGLSAGTSILFQMGTYYDPNDSGHERPHVVCCRTPILSAPTADTLTFAVPGGVPDGPLVAPYQCPSMFLVADVSGTTTKGCIITGSTRSGTSITYQAPGHRFVGGQLVGIGGVGAVEHEVVATATSVVPGVSFAVDCPGGGFDPIFILPGNVGCAFDAAVLPLFAAATMARRDDPDREAWYQNLVAPADEFPGVKTSLYEVGYQRGAQGPAFYVPWGGAAINASIRHPSMRAAVLHEADKWVQYGLHAITIYQIFGSWDPYGTGYGHIEYGGGEAASQQWQGITASIDANGESKAVPGPATRIAITLPAQVKVGSDPGYLACGPDGVLQSAVSVSLSAGPGIGFDPPTLAFQAGDSSPRAVKISTAGAGTWSVRATPSAGLGGAATAIFSVLDEDGNVGAVLLASDGFGRADGPPGSPWALNRGDCGSIVSGALATHPTANGTFNAGLVYLGGQSLLDSQVRFDLVPNGDGSWSPGGPSAVFRSDGQLGGQATAYTLVVRTDNQSTGHIYLFASSTGQGDTQVWEGQLDGGFDSTHRLRVVAACRGVPARFSIQVLDLTLGTSLYSASGIAPSGGPQIDAPGFSGYAVNGYANYSPAGVTIDDLRVSALVAAAAPPETRGRLFFIRRAP